MKILVIFNKSDKTKNKEKLDYIRNLLNKREINADIKTTEYKFHAIDIVKDTELTKYDALVSAGGDGTIYEILNGMMQNENKIPLGIIPVGTGNSFCKDIGLPDPDIDKAIEIIKKFKIKKIDIASFSSEGETRYFINIFGLGFVTDVIITANKFKAFGEFAYTIGVLHRALLLNSNVLSINIDGADYKFEEVLVSVSNSRYTGGYYLMAPTASLTDGMLDIVIAKKMSRIKLLKLFSKIFKGNHIYAPEVETFKGKNITISTDKVKITSPDGEIIGKTPVEISCLHKEIDFIVD